MAEPEEETDEEWRKIAEELNIAEQQEILARAQTAAGHAAARGQQRLQVTSPPPPQVQWQQGQRGQQQNWQIQASPPVQQQGHVHASPPTGQMQQLQLQASVRPPQLQYLQQQVRPQQQAHRAQFTGRPVLASTPPPPPQPAHPVGRHVQFPEQQGQANQNPSFPRVTSALPPHLSTNQQSTNNKTPEGQLQLQASVRPPQLQYLQQQVRPQQQAHRAQFTGRPVLASTPPPPPQPAHPVGRHVQFPRQQGQANQNPSFPRVTSALPPHPSTNQQSTNNETPAGPESSTTIASLRAENARLHQEYRTRIRHLEAQLQTTRTQGNLRSQLALAERELRNLRTQRPRVRMGATQATQAGEVVEATQTGLEVLKASIAPDVEREVEMFGCGGLDERVQGGLLRRELFRIGGYERLPGVSVCTGCEDWGVLTGVLVGLVEGEGWLCALKGLNVLLRVREARNRVIGMKKVGEVIECVYANEFGYGVLEKIVMGCAELGEEGDGVRRLVMGDERLSKLFRNGRDVDGVVRMGVMGILECDDGRVDDSEWGIVEGMIGECCKGVGEGVRMDILGIASVLAAEVVIRNGGVEGLLDFVCGRSVMGNDDGLVKGLEILATLMEEGLAGVGKVRVKDCVKIVGMGGLMALAKRNGVVGELACRIVDGLYKLEKRHS